MAQSPSPRARALTRALLASTALVGIGLGPEPARAEPLPTGGQVVSGGVTIGSPHHGALAITQSSQNAIVNWQGFSVGQGHRVDIRQPNAGAAILNRVTGATPSTIAGQLNANGQVYLVNPNGVTITRSGQVNAAGFVASSLGITDEDFKAGRRQFRGSGASAPVTNHGAITIGRGGYAALIGGQVTNTGTISVPMGRVGLGSGERATLDLSGDGFLQVAVPTKGQGRGALVRHSGTISADGGSVTLSAAAARDMARQAVNLSGMVEARSVSGTNGRITLSGGEGAVAVTSGARLDASGVGSESGGRVKISGRHVTVAGTLDASGAKGGRVSLRASEKAELSGPVLVQGTAGRGGRVTATAPDLSLHAALIDASGATGGGTVRIGGGRQGAGRLAHARTLEVDAGTAIRADATERGYGGDIVLWSDIATRFSGTITARGGAASGNGGEAEVSSKGVLTYAGFADLTAAKGSLGTLLLDPHNITIASGPDSNQSGFTATADDSVINSTTLLTALGSANVTVSTGSSGTQAGNIILAAGTPLSWNTGATLTLQAAGAVTLNGRVTAPAGGLTIAAGTGTSTASADLSVARFTLASGNWVQNAAMLPGFATGDFQVAGGASFLRAAGGNGTSADPYLLSDIYGVQGMGTASAGVNALSASYRLAGEIDASGTAIWNGGQGFSPVGTDVSPFAGKLDGAGHTITGLTIARPDREYVGLIGNIAAAGTLSDIGLLGGSVSGRSYVGALAGSSAGAISGSYATASVSGASVVGGLAGSSSGTISRSYATGSVSGTSAVGGLLGYNQGLGSVTAAYTTGTVIGSGSNVGGLVGLNSGVIGQAYANGGVSGGGSTGGLVGNNGGVIEQAYATGKVTSGSGVAGGLVGSNSGTLSATYWDTQTTEQLNAVGNVVVPVTGATGLTSAEARSQAGYTKAGDASQSFDFGTVWYQAGDLRPILRTEAAPGDMNGVIAVSNLHQLQLMGANLAGRYRLAADLDASATNATAASAGVFGAGGFVPVGRVRSEFTGSLDGAGHTITGLTISRSGEADVGLIGILGAGGIVSRLGLVGASITGSANVGGLVGKNDSTVSQSYATGSVSGTAIVGGLVGYNSGTVSQSYASGSASGKTFVGGLVGANGPIATVSQSYASGSVSGSDNVGGLVGFSQGTVSQSYASGSVSGSSIVGGLVGSNRNVVTSSYWDIQTTGQINGLGDGSTTGATGLITTQARAASSYAGFDFGSVWYQAGDLRPILRSEAAAADANGVTAVSNLHQLQLMGANLAGRYRLAADLDASATNDKAAPAGVFGAGGFVPVGRDAAQFTGSLDGAGHRITGLTIARQSQISVGLIGSLGAGGGVSGLGLVGASIAGSTGVGGLVGFNNGTVSQSYASGSVSGFNYVGGLVGNNFGTVSQSYASGSVSAESGSVGGLVGFNAGSVSQSYASGSVSARPGYSSVGGLVGENFGPVSQSYATGSVSGTSNVGGLVGLNYGAVSQSYASGSVSGYSNVGGLVGYHGGTVANAYWDKDTTGRPDGVGSGLSTGATGLTTARMQDLASFRANYPAFDFDTVWAPPNRVGQGGQSIGHYPELRSLSPVAVVTPASTTRVYGDANPEYASYVGVRAGDFVTGLGSLSTTATATSDVGSYAITASGATVTGRAGNSYRVVYLPDTLTVTRRPLTITANGQGKVYGDADPTLTYAIGGRGLVGGDSLSGSLSRVTGENVGAYAIHRGSLTASGNYALTYQGADLSVTARPLTLTADAQSRVYGEIYPSLTYRVGGRGLAKGEALTGALATAADARSNVGTYAIEQGSLAASGNYAVTYEGADLSVTARPLTLTADRQFRHYGDANPSLTYWVGGRRLVNGDTLSGSLATTADARSTVGTYAIGQGSLTASGNYAVTYRGADLTVAARPLILTAHAQSRVYGDANPALTYRVGERGLVNGDTLSGGLATAADARSNVGTYAIGQGNLAASSNYAVTYSGADLSVTARPLTLTVDAPSRVYGDANPALTYRVGGRGLVNGDTLSGGLTTDADARSNVNLYTIDRGSLAASGNYDVDYFGTFLEVTARPLTLTADTQSRVYGDANPALTYRVGGRGLVNGDALSGSLDTAADARSNVGTYGIGQGSLAASGNYAVSYVGADLAVTARPLTLTAEAQSRVYGDANPSLTYTTTSLGAGAALSGTLATAATTTSDVGSYAITQGSLTAAANPNYALTFQGANLKVGQRPVTVTADLQSRIYGDANPRLSYQVGGRGLVNGDLLSGGLATVADARSNVGTYGIGQGSLAASGNYAVSYVGADLAVTARPLTLTADAQSRIYGEANPSLSYRVAGRGLVNGDALTGELATVADARSNVGTYGIDRGSLAASSNYAVSYVGADLAVTARPLTLTADAQSRVYGEANPALTYQVGGRGLVNGDAVIGALATVADARSSVGTYDIGQGSLAAGSNYAVSYVEADLAVTARPLTLTADAQSRIYGDANPSLTYRVGRRGLVNGDTLTGELVTMADARSNAGTYGIGQGSLAASSNYAVTYQGADLTVTARPLTLTADAQSRVYGDANPSLTYTTTSLGAGAALSGTLATAATTTSDVGSYAITQGSLTAAANPNYALTFQGANLKVGQRPVTVTATGQSRAYGDANPRLSYRVGGRGLVNGDLLSGGLATAADARSNVGIYGIGRGSLAASGNYAVSYVGADLAVTARPLTLTADAQSRVYGEANPALIYQVGGRGLVNGDALIGALATVADARSNVGTYDIGQGSLAAGSNYAVSYVGADLAVTARPLTLTADAQSRIYGNANPSLTYQVGGRGLVNGDALTGGLATVADARSNVGSYGIDRGSLAASSNYAVSYVGADLAVTTRPLTITADAQSRLNGEANSSLSYRVGGRGLVNGDSLAGTLATVAEADSVPGHYTINQGSLTATANYSVTYLGADLTITPSPASAPRALIAPAATAFASTVQRVSTVTQTPAAPWSAPASGLLQTAAQTIADPRFDKAVVCLAGGCFVVPPPAPTAAQPGSTIRPQASATAP